MEKYEKGTKSDLIGSDPKTTPLQLRAAIALSACITHNISRKISDSETSWTSSASEARRYTCMLNCVQVFEERKVWNILYAIAIELVKSHLNLSVKLKNMFNFE